MNKSENFNASLKNVGFMLYTQNSEPASCSFLSLFNSRLSDYGEDSKEKGARKVWET